MIFSIEFNPFFSAVLNGVTENRKLIIESKIFDLSKVTFSLYLNIKISIFNKRNN